MITIRFETGFSLRYNSATHVRHHDNYKRLWSGDPDKGGRWIADIPLNCIVEAERACELSNPVAGLTPDTAADYVIAHLRLIGNHQLKLLKRKISFFDMRTGAWGS
jgi:hypothetical protein